MTNIEIITDSANIEQVIIDNGDGSFTSMPKSTYDAQQASSTLPSNSSTPQAGA